MNDICKLKAHGNPLSVRISAFQHREWLLWKIANGRSDRVVASARRLRWPVDEKVVSNRLQAALQRHPVLRMVFNTEEPCASILPEVHVPLIIRYALPDEKIASAIARFSTEVAKASFSISEAPAMRAVLVHAGYGSEKESAMAIVAPPIIADEKSLMLLLEEIDKNVIPEADDETFLSWTNQFSFLDRKEIESQKLAFYKRVLAGAAFQMDLPTDRTRPPVHNNKGDIFEIEIPEAVQKALKESAAAESINPAVVMIAALAGFLGRVSRQPDVVIGLSTDLRPLGCDSCIGPFENNTVLRVVLEDTVTGNCLVKQIRDSLTAMEPHRDLPFEVLIDALQPERDPSRMPIYQVHFAHRIRADEHAWLSVPTGRVDADLDVVFEERGPALALSLGYRTDIYERDTIKHIAGHLVELVRVMCDRPDEIVKRIPVCSPQVRGWILETLGIRKEFSCEMTIHGLVSAAAALNPENTAVCSGEARLSYRELNRRANQLAHRLRRSGVVRDMAVALCMERSEELIIALLAILKAGGAYVPIEPANPKERIDFVLADSRAQIVLTEPALKGKVYAPSAKTLVIEPGGAAFASEPETDPEEVADPESLAYVIYTSGSTGRPKGVLIEHGNVIRLFKATADWFKFDEHDVWTMFHSAAFDFSVWEIWGALIHGGRLVVVPYLASRSPDVFLELLVREKVTVLNQTPSAFRQLIQAENETGSRDLALQHVIFGGEALEFESLRPWFERHGDQSPRLVNMYGITETCVHVTYRPVSMADLDSGGTSVIGLPIPDLSTYVVDETLQLLPPGIPGELVVGGAGLARGYLERPELTTERFVPDPFSSRPGARLYRSGDLVRLLPTGELDYLGRIDQQVKIRGFRIETGEIEAVLRKSGLLRDVAVIPWQHNLHETQIVAYVVSDRSAGELREAVRASLPEYMVPAKFVSVPSIPMTANGKVDRKALPAPMVKGNEKNAAFVAPSDEFERIISQAWCEVLGMENVSTRESFFNIGGSSLGLVRVAGRLKKLLDRDINVVSLFQYPTVSALAKYLSQKGKKPASISSAWVCRNHAGDGDHEPVAIVGMAGRFQGAGNIDALWDLLVSGKEAITFFEDKDLDPSLDSTLITDPAYVKARGILDGAGFFDPEFFGMSPREAEVTDPQQRVLLEIAWEALEHAGVDPSLFPGQIAVYAGVYNNTYYLNNVLKRPDMVANVGEFQAMIGNEKDFVATRIAHRLDLKGPALSIHTACSTSLVAVAHAFYALRTHQCDLALAGAAAVTCPQKSGYLYQDGGMLSPDGHTCPFDEGANGTVFSDGAAMLVLRRLSDAIDSGDTIHALIRGVATNNDGGKKMSFSAPTAEGQAEVISKALSVAGIHPEAISYIETHGTATPLGDPIEAEGLRKVFGESPTRLGYCALGSIKSNLGHVTAASGAAGLIKTVLALNREQIPPTLGFSKLNPNICFDNSAFYVAAKLQPWKRQPGNPRRAGVSSFGVGGTNAHVVVEEAPEPTCSGPSKSRQLIVLSARTDTALQVVTSNLAAHLENHFELNLADVAFTLQCGRKSFEFRRAIVASGKEEATTRLRSLDAKYVLSGKSRLQEPSVVFLFPGQGAQYFDMGRELFEGETVFRESVDRCAMILRRHLDLDLRTVLYPDTEAPVAAEMHINQTWLAQPAIFVVEYALARLWMSWGVKPAVLIGHSIGEYVAAVLAEVFSLDDALALLSTRARLMQALPAGTMLAVRLGAGELERLIPDGVAIAAINSSALCAVSGPTELLREFHQDLETKGIAVRLLHTSHAFHSAMMDPMLPEFAIAARRTPVQAPKLPWVSTCTGSRMRLDDLAGGEYWARQVRQPVCFAETLESVIGDTRNILLEVGPGQSLSQLARQHAKKPADAIVIASMGTVGEKGGDLSAMLTALGRLWISGVGIDWKGFSARERRRRVALPSYPFERKLYWVEPANVEAIIPQTTQAAVYNTREPTKTNGDEMHSAQPSITVAIPHRKDRLVVTLRELLQNYSGADHSRTDANESFMDLGFDSLLITQVSQGISKRFNVKVTFRQMLGDLCTLDSLAAFLDAKMPPDVLTPPDAGPTPASSAKAAPEDIVAAVQMAPPAPVRIASSGTGGLVETVIHQQMAIMAQQLDLLRQAGATAVAMPAKLHQTAHPGTASNMPVVTAVNLEKHSHFGPFKAIEKGAAGGLTQRQQTALDKLIARYNRRTAKSKTLAQQQRACFCDPRAAGNFRQLWKEMVYPIACARSKGSRIWDIDGNEYIDVTMGFGANYLGHSPDFVMRAVEEQMKLGVEIGPQSPIAGEVARMICEFTGMDRATFCNTGSEAVMAAFRLARTVTGRDKIVYFYGDYHGVFDEVLGRPALFDGVPGAMPIAPGIPHLANMMILEYGNPSSLDTIRQLASEIAGVIVEPVQSRHPALQPREFLQELRQLTREHEVALIFDEVITGFRIAPGGAQEFFGVKADLATYGKVIGGGMPIGVLAGSATYMDALDGGFWQYGDDSSPPTGVTFFAGTFVRHPLAMAAAHAVLKHLKSAGPSLQERTNRVTARFVDSANAFFQGMQLPMQLQKFSTTFYYDFHTDLKYAGLLFYYLRDRGIHIWEGRVGHLSVAHTDEDMDRVLQAFQESVEEMQAGGFLPESSSHSISRSDQKSSVIVTGSVEAQSTDARIPPNAQRFTLAEAQREMWIGAQMKPEAAGPHHACTGIYLDGDLDMASLRRAIRVVVQRHEGLRCTFGEEGTEAILHSEPIPEAPLDDLSDLPEPRQKERMNEILHQEARRLLDLTKGPLVDFRILKLSARQHMLIFTAQMIVCDGWSHYVVFEDLGALYTVFTKGEELFLDPAVPMREFALWEQANAGSVEARECEAFWLSQFKTVPPPIEFPTARPRPPARTFEGDRQVLTLPAELCGSIRKLAKEQKNSYFAVLLAAFHVWLNRVTGARDLVVGVPFAAQSQLGMDTLIGQCANILPLRVQIDPTESFSGLLKKTWSSVLDAQEHWNFTYGRLIPCLDLPRDSSRIPLVSVLFNIDPPMSKVKFGDLKHSFITGPRYYFQYDLGFNLVEDGDTIHVECDYNRKLFDGRVVLRWVAGYQALLEKIAENPDLPVGRLPMMNERKTQRLLSINTGLITTDVPPLTVDGMFKAQAGVSPDAVAAAGEGWVLTYRELDHRSSRLGSYLATLGIGPDTVVGVCVDRSMELPVALLSILKTGGAYVLIDPLSSSDDVIHIVNNIGVPIILVDDHARSRLPATTARIIHLNEEDTDRMREGDALPSAELDSDRLACIICKDHSQGGKQGVEITHRAIMNCLHTMKRELAMLAEDEVLCHSAISCGLEMIEIWLPLMVGARTVICPDAAVRDHGYLHRIIANQNITAMLATPSVWRMLLNSGWQASRRFKALCWGEALQPGLAERLADACTEVWNIYGAMETTFVSMIGRVHAGAPVILGQPIDNTHVVLADEQFEPVTVGVPGEILVSGAGLARGYRNLPALAAEKFIYQSIGARGPNRFFRTGDIARYRPDGTMEFVGRMDRQKTVRGFLVEPAEVESILQGHSAVRDAAVSYREDIDGSPGFVAYILLDTLPEKSVSFGTAELIREIRRLVRSRLPEYMLPVRFVVLETLPRKSNGRVDHAALPAPTEADGIFEDYVAPRNRTEEILAGIWQEFLKLDKVSVKDSFFDLGGQSLMAVRLFNRIENEFGRRFPLAILFRAPTIDQLARKLTADEDAAPEWPSLVPIQPRGTKAPLFLVHGAGGNVLLYRALAKRLEPDYPVYGLQSQGLDGQSKPLQTIEEMADRYLQEIRTIQPGGPYLLGGYCLGGTIAYEMAQRLVVSGEKVAMIAMFDTYNFIRALKVGFLTFLMQKIRFHWSNLVQLRPSTMWRYIKEKKRIAGDGGWAHIRTEMPGTTLQEGVARAESGIEVSVQKLNDHAADIYDPRPYSGLLTLFKPHINYKFYPDPKLGWGDLATGGLDIIELPINPHAMLIEPYVGLLTQELKARMDSLDTRMNPTNFVSRHFP